jgi:hypothetical protein
VDIPLVHFGAEITTESGGNETMVPLVNPTMTTRGEVDLWKVLSPLSVWVFLWRTILHVLADGGTVEV